MASEIVDDSAEIIANLHRLIDSRSRVTDEDFKSGLPAEVETAIIERMTNAGYTIGLDEDYRNEWWPPNDDEESNHA